MNPIDELASLLPPAPQSRELPHRDEHQANLLAVIDADRTGGAPRSSRLQFSWLQSTRPVLSWRLSSSPGETGRRWLAPSAAAIAVVCAVVVVAVAAVAVRSLSGSGSTPGSRPDGRPAGNSGAPARPPAGSPLTVTRHWTVPAGSFTSVAVSTDVGSVTVTGSAAASAAVTAIPSYRGAAPRISYEIAAGALTVHTRCPQERHCQVALQLRVPAGVPVRVTASLGSVRLTGLRAGAVAHSDLGNVDLTRVSGRIFATSAQGNVNVSAASGQITAHTSLGAVDLARVSGSVTAQTDEGSVSATGLAAYRATLTSAQGSVNAAFSVAPELVKASSQLGSVTVRLPSGTSYRVTATASLGSASVTVPQSRVSRHVVKASSQLGSVTVTG